MYDNTYANTNGEYLKNNSKAMLSLTRLKILNIKLKNKIEPNMIIKRNIVECIRIFFLFLGNLAIIDATTLSMGKPAKMLNKLYNDSTIRICPKFSGPTVLAT